MEEKFTTNLLQYLSDGQTETSSAVLSGQIDALSANGTVLKELFLALEGVVDQFKGKSEVYGLISTDKGWPPLIKLLQILISSSDFDVQLKERVLNVLLELVRLSNAAAIDPNFEQLANLTLTLIEDCGEEAQKTSKNCPPANLRLAAMRVLSAIFEKFDPAFPTVLEPLFARLQCVLLAVLADKGDEEARELANKCITLVIANHSDPNGVFAVLSDMSGDTELMLKDDPLLDDLIEKCWARDNQLQGR
uniref:Uncharacterized protein n=1 Tax=Globodera rostochiensis TaxID=31243 RepID=A0A914I6K1_GLORO